MTYISGNITSANPAADLYALMDPAFASAGFTLVDTVVISTRTHKIWKSNAANNQAGLDWYLDVTYTTTGAGSIWLSPFEDFNAVTDIGTRGPIFDTTTTIEGTYFSKYGATGSALETNWMAATGTINQITLSTASVGYWMSITQNRVIAMSSLAPSRLVYCGFWEPNTAYSTNAGAALYPLIVGSLDSYLTSTTGTTDGYAAVTRAPRATTFSRWNRIATFWTGHFFPHHPEGGYGVLGAADASPFLGTIPPRGKYVYVLMNPSTGTFTAGTVYANNSIAAVNVGRAKDALSFLSTSTVTRGDTVTIDGDTWVLTSSHATYLTCLAFRAI